METTKNETAPSNLEAKFCMTIMETVAQRLFGRDQFTMETTTPETPHAKFETHMYKAIKEAVEQGVSQGVSIGGGYYGSD